MIFCDFLSHWPTLKHVKRARRSTLESFFRDHNANRTYLVEERIQGIQAATALTEDDSVIRPNQMAVQAMVEQLRVLLLAIGRFDAEIDAVGNAMPDYGLFAALSGAGHILAPRLLLAFGEDRDRYTNAAQIQSYSGALQWSSAAATSVGCIGVSPVPRFSARRLLNGQARPSRDRIGQKPTTDNNAPKVAHTGWPFVLWRSSGYALFIVAGKHVPRMTNPFT